jgi:hypothetical protein
MPSLEIVDYTEKSVAVFGDTKSFKEELLKLGGKFNGSLTRNGEKVAGWIFSKANKEKLNNLNTSILKGEVKAVEYTETPRYVEYKMFLELVTRVERLEAQLYKLGGSNMVTVSVKNKVNKVNKKEEKEESEESDTLEESSEEETPSLLAKMKLKK